MFLRGCDAFNSRGVSSFSAICLPGSATFHNNEQQMTKNDTSDLGVNSFLFDYAPSAGCGVEPKVQSLDAAQYGESVIRFGGVHSFLRRRALASTDQIYYRTLEVGFAGLTLCAICGALRSNQPSLHGDHGRGAAGRGFCVNGLPIPGIVFGGDGPIKGTAWRVPLRL